MTLREKIARLICEDAMLQCGGPDSKYGTMRERVENNWRDYTTPADAVLALLSDPANYTDGMWKAFEEVFREAQDIGGIDDSVAWARGLRAAFTAARPANR